MATTRAIELRTAVPGPRSREIMARLDGVVAAPLAVNLPIVVEEARGALLTDVDGNTFIDLTGGVGVLNVGHSHPHVVAAIADQSGLTKADADRALEAMFKVVKKALKSGDSVSLVGFGTFVVRKRAARTGRNPRTGDTIKIKASKVPAFKAGKALKDAVG